MANIGSYKTYGRWDYVDTELIEDKIRKEKHYGRYPGQEPSPKERSLYTGFILIFAGFFMLVMIMAVMYPRLSNGFIPIVLICFPIPVIFIITGILLLFNMRSGKLIFALICIVFGLVVLIVYILNLFDGRSDVRSGGAAGACFGIMIYGFYLFRRHMKG